MDGSRIRKEKVVDSKIFGYVWTGPKTRIRKNFMLLNIRDSKTITRLLDPLFEFGKLLMSLRKKQTSAMFVLAFHSFRKYHQQNVSD